MTIHVQIPEPPASRVAEAAKQQGTSPEELVLEAVSEALASRVDTLNEVLSSVRKAYEESGMTEDESFDFLEAEKHAMRFSREVP